MNFDKDGNVILEKFTFKIKYDELIEDLIKEIDEGKDDDEQK